MLDWFFYVAIFPHAIKVYSLKCFHWLFKFLKYGRISQEKIWGGVYFVKVVLYNESH